MTDNPKVSDYLFRLQILLHVSGYEAIECHDMIDEEGCGEVFAALVFQR
ncbi:hypothetical protein [Oricola thermophila]|uniref:Uncharacterized protein n=1 Tax=Oricola thermophila TaxID=2742145 RepID=A0A6N1VF61_9HYPH|nr:hypothetical protein [Oricola thermophila]QKV17872.1 hypothetical protein HTY61_05055 [Oricola thermophila]